MSFTSRIGEFYQNGQILITGGTGFVGKLLISKLFLSCSEIGKIVLLIRKKEKEINVEQRMEYLFADEIFDSLKENYPSYSDKVELVGGDCEQENLGLEESDRIMLTERITHIFHCAGNVEFDLDIATEVKINMIGALAMIKLAKQTKNLKSFVHVSSAFAYCHLPIVEEKYYEPSTNYETLMKLTNTNLLNENEKRILGKTKSTYFFSKAMAESVVFKEGKQLPAAIFRPSAIISTWKEPIPGWTNKAFAPTAMVKLIALGRISSVHCNDTAIVDMVPADLTINALIAVGWDVYNRYERGIREPRVYNYTSMVDNPLRFEQFLYTCFGSIQQKPPLRAIWYPTLSIHRSSLVNRIFCSLTRPWLLTVFVCLFGTSKEKYSMMRSAALYRVLTGLLSSIVKHQPIYTSYNVSQLWQDMDEYDRRIYFFDVKQFDWETYLKNYYDGILHFVLNERDRDEKAVRRRTMVLQIIHYSTQVILYTFGFILLRALFEFVR